MVMDAFSSDAVPAHLLTSEAFDIYLKHLNPNGLIIVNITNRYLDLQPVVAAAAERIGFSGMMIYDEGNLESYYEPNSWVVLTENRAFFEAPAFNGAEMYELELKEGFDAWTDDYSNIWDVTYWEDE